MIYAIVTKRLTIEMRYKSTVLLLERSIGRGRGVFGRVSGIVREENMQGTVRKLSGRTNARVTFLSKTVPNRERYGLCERSSDNYNGIPIRIFLLRESRNGGPVKRIRSELLTRTSNVAEDRNDVPRNRPFVS